MGKMEKTELMDYVIEYLDVCIKSAQQGNDILTDLIVIRDLLKNKGKR